MRQFILRRLIQAVPTLFGIMLITFTITRLSPADPIQLIVGADPDITEADRDSLRRAFGLDQPLPTQFVLWAGNVLRLEFGYSYVYRRPVIDMLAERVPNSLQYGILGVLLALLIGAPLGVIAALTRGRWPDHVIRSMSVVLHALPGFYVGLLFVLWFGVQLRWFPVGSMNAVGTTCTLCWDRAWHLVGPVVLAASGGIAFYPRLLRTEVLEILGQDFVRTARGKGLDTRTVVVRHVVRNALIPVVTILGGVLTIVVSGSLVTETIFNWPGFGRLGYDAALSKDYPVVQAVVLLSGTLLLISYILRDIAYTLVDPRISVR